MKRRVFLSLLLTAAVLLLPAFVLLGCQDLNSTDVTSTYPSTTAELSTTTTSLAVQTDTSTQSVESTPTTSSKTPPTVAKATTTTAKLVGQAQTYLTLELAVPTRYEDTDPLMKWTGYWQLNSYNKASGGTYNLTQVMGANVVVKFKGTSISLVVLMQPEMGVAKLTLDGSVYLVDLYSSVRQSKTVWTSPTLANGTHTLRVEENGTKNPAASWPFITIDAVDVQGTLVP
jgi:hypothetical protein